MTCAIRPDGNTYVSTMRCLPNGSKENFSALFAPPCPGDALPRMVDRSASMEFPISPSIRGGGGSGGEGGTLGWRTVSRTRVTDFAGFPQSFSRYTGTLGGAIGSYLTCPPGECGSGHPFVVLSSVSSAASVLCRESGGGGDVGGTKAIAADAAPYIRAAFAELVGGYGPPLMSAPAEMLGLSGTAVAAGVSFRLLQGSRGEEEVASASTKDRWKTSLSITEEQKELRSVCGRDKNSPRNTHSVPGTPSVSVRVVGALNRGDAGWPWRPAAALPPRRGTRSKGRKASGAGVVGSATVAADGPKPKFRRVRNRDPATRDSPAWAKVVRNRESARRSNERRRQERARAAAAAAASASTRAADLVDAAGGVGSDARIAGRLSPTDKVPPRTPGHAGIEDLLRVAGAHDGTAAESGEAVPTPPSAADWQLWVGGFPAPGWSGAPAPPAGSLLSLDSAVSHE